MKNSMKSNMKNSVKALFRDTAIEVAALSDGGEVESMSAWQSRCVDLVEKLRREMRLAGIPEEDAQDISYAQCGLLDETALRNLPENLRGEWEINPLQVRFFNSYNAGEIIYDRIETLLRKNDPNPDLVDTYTIILNLGFQGRYLKRDVEERLRLIDSLSRLRLADFNDGFLVASGRRTEASFWQNMSPLAWMIIAGALPILLWMLLDHSLESQIQDILKTLS